MLPPRKRIMDLLLSVWWVSWFGIIGGFLCVGMSELKIEFSRGADSRLSLALLVAVFVLWIFAIFRQFQNLRTRLKFAFAGGRGTHAALRLASPMFTSASSSVPIPATELNRSIPPTILSRSCMVTSPSPFPRTEGLNPIP